MKVLITGIAGFIGYHTAKLCATLGHQVVGVDSLHDYYHVSLKNDRLKDLGLSIEDSISSKFDNLSFKKIDLSDGLKVSSLFNNEKFDCVIHLAALAGVRYSIINPHAYIKSNIDGFLNILEGCRHANIKHLIFASSSSVYGQNVKVPFKVEDPVDHPISLYASTKRSNELMAHTYSHLYRTPVTGLRLFSVYGPWGRPDMAPFIFTEKILKNDIIKVFNNGNMERDFTYIDDVVYALVKLIDFPPEPGISANTPDSSTAPFRLYNVGTSSPVNLLSFINLIEKYTGKRANKQLYPIQPGDLPRIYANVEDLYRLIGYKPTTSVEEGLKKFVDWYRGYYNI